MKSKHTTRMTALIVLMILGGVAAASAANLGTVVTGEQAYKRIWFNWYYQETQITFITVGSPVFSIGRYTGSYGEHIYPYSRFYIDVTMESDTPGNYSTTMVIYFSTGEIWGEPLAGTVIEPCDPLSVSVTSPTNGSTKSPNAAGNVILEASASSSATRVEFYVDGAQVANDTVAPYAYAWPAKTASHQVYAKAYDACGNSLASSSVSFTVNCGNPTVTLTKPVNGSTVTPNAQGNVILEATASHSTGIQKVNFFIDGGLVATDTTAPYAFAWPASSGSHLARARAFSNCGGDGVSSNAATFTVNN